MTAGQDSYRNVTKYTGQNYVFAPSYLRPRDPTTADIKPKEQQGYYNVTSLWNNTTNGNIWALASITNNLANWVMLGAAGAVGVTRIGVDAATPPGTNPVLPNTGLITVTGGQVASGTAANVIRTDSLAANTFTIEVQQSTSSPVSDPTVNGVSHYSSRDFTVDGSGFVELLAPQQASGFYSDGRDGSVIFDGLGAVLGIAPIANTYTLVRDIYLLSGIVDLGVSIITNDYRIFAQNTLTNNGTIQWNGNNGLADGTPGSGLQNTIGTINTQTGGSAPSTGGGTGQTGVGGDGDDNNTSPPFNLGGDGGAGGAGGSAGGAGGVGVQPGVDSTLPNALPQALKPNTISSNGSSNGFYDVCGGTGGGGGGGNGVIKGGGGGGGGGVLVVAAFKLIGTGNIQALGGNGGSPGAGTSNGGGGGGGGGFIVVVSSSVIAGAVPNQTISVAGGIGGTGFGTGTNGSNGNAGQTVILYA